MDGDFTGKLTVPFDPRKVILEKARGRVDSCFGFHKPAFLADPTVTVAEAVAA